MIVLVVDLPCSAIGSLSFCCNFSFCVYSDAVWEPRFALICTTLAVGGQNGGGETHLEIEPLRLVLLSSHHIRPSDHRIVSDRLCPFRSILHI